MLLKTELELSALEHLLENAGTGIARIDSDGTYTHVSQRYAGLFGFSPVRLLNASWTSSIFEADREIANLALSRAEEEGVIKFSIRGAQSHASKRIEMTITRIDNNAHSDYYIHADSFEIGKNTVLHPDNSTDNVELTGLFTTSPVGMLISDTNQQIVWANNAFLRLFDLREHEVISRSRRNLILKHTTWFLSKADHAMVNITMPETGKYGGDEIECHIQKPRERKQCWVVYACNPVYSGKYNGGFVEYFYDVSRQKSAEMSERESRKRVQNLVDKLQTAMEKERKSLARELHDELGQSLTGVRIELSGLRTQFQRLYENETTKKILGDIDRIIMIIDRTLNEIRRILFDIRSTILEDLGLAAAISNLLDEFEGRTKISVTADIDIDRPIVNSERDLVVFRILQEALTNIARHAQASAVDVSLSLLENNSLKFEIEDDGIGIEQEHIFNTNSLGLIGMRERARDLGGRLTISKLKNGGTRVSLTLPGRKSDNID